MSKGDIVIIVAMDNRQTIGSRGKLPWHLSADMHHFKAVTIGKPLVMGRKTYQSIGHALPGRENIILTRSRNFLAAGCILAHTLEEALLVAGDVDEIIVMGGADIYQQFLPQATRIYLTEVHADVKGDAYFPKFDRSEWLEYERENYVADHNNDFNYSFVGLKRK